MKKRLLFFILISIVFIGCSSDSDSNSLPITEENLLGKWYYKGMTIDNGPFQNHNNSCPTSKDYMEVLISHNAESYRHAVNCEIDAAIFHSWTLNGDWLTMINQDPIVVAPNIYKVLSITEEQLVLRMDFHPTSPSDTEVYKYYYTRN
jgi:hypothetical protein